jgi:hypothetical protein
MIEYWPNSVENVFFRIFCIFFLLIFENMLKIRGKKWVITIILSLQYLWYNKKKNYFSLSFVYQACKEHKRVFLKKINIFQIKP